MNTISANGAKSANEAIDKAVAKMQEKPVETGAALVAIGLLLKTAFVIKIIAYAIITCGVFLLWKAFKPSICGTPQATSTPQPTTPASE